MAELVLVLPLFVTTFLFGMLLTEVVRAKLKLLEASRFAAFEMTRYVLDDYGADGAPRHDLAFREAATRTSAAAKALYADLDSVDDRGRGSLVAGYQGFAVTLDERAVTMVGGRFSTRPLQPFSGRFADAVLTRLDGTAAQAHQLFGFNQKGLVSVETGVRVDNRLLPRRLELRQLSLRAGMSLIASGWQLPDGSDARMGEAQAGEHRGGSIHALWQQVDRMAHLGLRSGPSAPRRVGPLPLSSPSPAASTFVVSHNYGLPRGDVRGCNDGEGNRDPSHPAPDGMNNLDRSSALDHPYRKCFDTAPFRDVAAYDAATQRSLYVQLFLARGGNFMGCPNAQADDPTWPGDSPNLRGDVNTRRRTCGARQ